MKSSRRTALLALASIALLPIHAQTVTTPPRTITGQQETPGVDSTFQGNVVPNAQTSTFHITVAGSPPAPPAPPPAPPAVTCTAGVVNTTVTQAASCPAGYITTAGAATFTQTATRTTTTSCPGGPYGSPSVSTTTGAWSPTPAAACPIARINTLPLNGGTWSIFAAHSNAGGVQAAQADMTVTFASNGTYAVAYYYPLAGANSVPASGPGTFASGTWLPAGRAASDFTISITSTPTTVIIGTGNVGSKATAPTAQPCGNYPGKNTGVVSTSVAGSTGTNLCIFANESIPPRGTPDGDDEIDATITVTIKDNRYGVTATTTFKVSVSVFE